MNVALAMIVKDEAENVEGLVASAAPFIDSFVIVDTGSSDGTPVLFRQVFSEIGIEGDIYSHEWRGFGDARSRLMQLAGSAGSDYLMLLDADMRPRHPGPLPELTADCYHGRILGSLDYSLPILVTTEKAWRYEGVAHSYLACDGPYSEEVLPGLEIEDLSHTTEVKLRGDLELLSAEHARRPLDARTAFYLAQTYADLDMIPEAIAMYRLRVNLSGWDEETYVARQRLGALLCENVSFLQGAKELLAAWEMRPSRAEALRTLSYVAGSVADKIPYPDDRLFVRRDAYAKPPIPSLPPLPNIEPTPRPAARQPLTINDVSAVIVTRGNVDLDPILATLPYPEVVVWDNSTRGYDYKPFGRYVAIPETTRPVIYWQDDDVIFTVHDALLAAYEPERLVCNMDESWIDACGYRDLVGMQGAGSLCDAELPNAIFSRYLDRYPYDDDMLTEADFIFGVLCPFTVVDLGYEAREFADDADRLYTQSWQPIRKQMMIERCREILATA